MIRSLIELESTAVAAAGRTSNPPHRHMQVEKISSSVSSSSSSPSISASVAANGTAAYLLPTEKLSFTDRFYLDTPKVVINSHHPTATSASSATYLSIASVVPALAGGLSGVMTKVVTQPLDFLRTRLQIHEHCRPGLYTTFGTIWKSEGVLTFYRGLSANLVGSGFNWGAYFLIYELCKSGLSYCQINNMPTNSQSQSQLNSFHHFASAYIAGASSVLVTNPIWMIKTRLQIRNDYKGVFDCAKRIYLEEGPFRFYRGIIPGLALCSNKAIQFTVYEKLKFYANFYYFNPQHKSINDTTLPSRYYLVMGGLSKIISATATYPMHLLRARLFQSNSDNSSKYKGIMDCVKRVYKHEGAFGFYKGISASLLKTVPGSALTFCFYENLMLLFSFIPKEYNHAE